MIDDDDDDDDQPERMIGFVAPSGAREGAAPSWASELERAIALAVQLVDNLHEATGGDTTLALRVLARARTIVKRAR